MNPNHIDTKLTFTIPYVSRHNGVYCTKEAIENAARNIGCIPIIDNNSRVIGLACGPLSGTDAVEWDDENKLCHITIDGVLYDAGATVYPYEMVNGKITSMEFASISLNEAKENNNEIN